MTSSGISLRATVLLIGLSAALLPAFIPATLFAQTCSPPCGEGQVCSWFDINETIPGCAIAPSPNEEAHEVDELVVTASSRSRSFSEFVYDVIVPFFDLALIPLLYALAFIVFLIGIVRYFFMGGEEARAKGKSLMLWGIVGLVVIFSIWGIVRLLLASFNLG